MHTRIISVFLSALIVCCAAFGSTVLAQDKVETSEVESAAAEDSARDGTASAAKTKEEVIYASLKADGSVGSVYAVNIILHCRKTKSILLYSYRFLFMIFFVFILFRTGTEE